MIARAFYALYKMLGRSSSSLSCLSQLLLLVLTSPRQLAADFIQYPSNVAAAVGTVVTLGCVADQPTLAWAINGQQLLDQTNLQRFLAQEVILGVGETVQEGQNYTTTLTIPATVVVNDTINGIVCQAGPSQFSLEDSPTFTFSVYGLPLAPGQLEVRGVAAHQLILHWSSPFTLPGETVNYTLVIADQVTGENETVCITDTGYTHTVSESEALTCHPFVFSVFSVNDVGHSINSSSAPPTVHPSAPGPLAEVQSEVSYDSQAVMGSQADVSLFFQNPVSCFTLTYNVSLHDKRTGIETSLLPSASTDSETVTLHMTGLRENTCYSAIVSAYNNFQFSSDSPVQSEQVSFVTSGVQSVAVLQYGNETLRITCTFAKGSSSTGCRVSLTVDSVTTTFIDLTRSNDALEVVHYDSSTRGLPSSVEAQDIGVTDPLIISGSIETTPSPPPSLPPSPPPSPLPSPAPSPPPSPPTPDIAPVIVNDLVFTKNIPEEGDDTMAVCEWTGSPIPVATWFKNGEPLDEPTLPSRIIITLTNNDFGSELQIQDVVLDDAGDYLCNVTNRIGSDSRATKLTIRGKSDNPSLSLSAGGAIAIGLSGLGLFIILLVIAIIIFFLWRTQMHNSQQRRQNDTDDASLTRQGSHIKTTSNAAYSSHVHQPPQGVNIEMTSNVAYATHVHQPPRDMMIEMTSNTAYASHQPPQSGDDEADEYYY